jgi:hypothetical protein
MVMGTADVEGASLTRTTIWDFSRQETMNVAQELFPEDQSSEMESSNFSASVLSGGSGDDHFETDDEVTLGEDINRPELVPRCCQHNNLLSEL